MPIHSRQDYKRFLAADAIAHGIEKVSLWHWMTRPTLRYQRRLRYVEYLCNNRCGLFWRPYVWFWRWRLQRMGVIMGFDIHPNVFGPGLCIVHWGTIVVSPAARIGANCRIHPSTCIGMDDGMAPMLGDNVYIGPGAKLFGGIVLGDSVKIGANAVVNKSFPAGVSVAGVPARVVSGARELADI